MPELAITEMYHVVSEAFRRGDVDTLNRYIDPNVVWHIGTRAPVDGKAGSPMPGDIRGREAVIAFMDAIREGTGDTFRVEPIAVAESGTHGFAWQRVTAVRDQAKVDMTEAMVFEVEEGRIVEVWHRPEEDQLEAFLGLRGASRP